MLESSLITVSYFYFVLWLDVFILLLFLQYASGSKLLDWNVDVFWFGKF